MNLPPVSPFINNAFAVAKAKYYAQYTAWTDFSARLAGRFSLFAVMTNMQRQGEFDLLLRCMEDEFAANKAAAEADPPTGSIFAFHYQLMLSEAWVVGCYEILRALQQRDEEARARGERTSGVSEMDAFKSIFADLELLRIPMAKFEAPKERGKKGLIDPLPMQRVPANNDATDRYVYDRKDPKRSYTMVTRINEGGSVAWFALDHRTRSERWVERRDLAERLLALSDEIVPAGLLEAQERAAAKE